MKYCYNNCCEFCEIPYSRKSSIYKSKFGKKKGGVFFFNKKDNKVLLVQSSGDKWGFPKGSMEKDDCTIKDCAIREVFEETGMMIKKDELINEHRINRAYYYYIETDDIKDVLNPDGNTDVSGIVWINVCCLKHMCISGDMKLNLHCRKLLKKILDIDIE